MLHVSDSGNGPPLVLIHGLSAWHRQFDALHPHLDQWRVIAIDLPGFGRSASPAHSLSMAEVADVVHADLAARGIDRYRLAGHSMGAAIAVEIAERHAGSIERLVLLAPAGLVVWGASEPRAAGPVRSALRSIGLRMAAALTFSPHLRALSLSRLVHDPVALSAADARLLLAGARRAHPAALARARSELGRAGIAARLPALAVPIDLVWGDDDRLVPVSWAGVLMQVRPDMHPTIIKGAGHVLTMEAPERVASAITHAPWDPVAPDLA